MNILEFQAKKLCREYGIPVPKSILLHNTSAIENAVDLNYPVLLKAQVFSEKRARTGGMYMARSVSEAKKMLPEMFTSTINQQPVSKILVEELVDFDIGFRFEICYSAGKFDIEFSTSQSFNSLDEKADQNVSEENEFKCIIDPVIGILDSTIIDIASALELHHKNWDLFDQMIKRFWALFQDWDLEKLVINPLVVTPSGELRVLGVDMAMDEQALFRQPSLRDLIEYSYTDLISNTFKKLGCEYYLLNGKICVISTSMQMCNAIKDILKTKDNNASEMLSIGEDFSGEKIAIVLKMIEDNKKSSLIVFHAAGLQDFDDELIRGINTYLANSLHPLPIILRSNDLHLKKKLRGVHIIKSLSGLTSKVREIKLGGKI